MKPAGRALLLAATLAFIAGPALLSGCGDGDEIVTVTQSSPATTPEASQDGITPAADLKVTEPTGFTSPTGNIGCVIDRATVRCDIGERDWKPPKAPKNCDLDFGQSIELPAGGAPELVCAGDTTLGAGDPLPYGDSIAAGLLRCESAESGITCSDVETGRGFSLSRQSYEPR